MLSAADVIEHVRAVLANRGDAIAAAYLFGSMAGRQRQPATSRVLRDATLMIDRDPYRRYVRSTRARNAYFDLKPYIDRYRRVSPAATWTDTDLVAKKLAQIETCVDRPARGRP